MFKSVYFDSIRSYLPDDARAILVDQIPKIREAVAADIDDFGNSLGARLKKELDDAVDSRQRVVDEISTRMKTLIDTISAGAPANLGDATQRLKNSLDAYENQWKSFGTKVREVTLAAVKSAGVPLPI